VFWRAYVINHTPNTATQESVTNLAASLAGSPLAQGAEVDSCQLAAYLFSEHIVTQYAAWRQLNGRAPFPFESFIVCLVILVCSILFTLSLSLEYNSDNTREWQMMHRLCRPMLINKMRAWLLAPITLPTSRFVIKISRKYTTRFASIFTFVALVGNV
jgi:hypothetical protein